MKFAIYSRKSKTTDKGESIGNQVEMCRNYINANAPGEEHEFLIYEDEGFSGKNTKRPEFLRMMQDAKKKRFQLPVGPNQPQHRRFHDHHREITKQRHWLYQH